MRSCFRISSCNSSHIHGALVERSIAVSLPRNVQCRFHLARRTCFSSSVPPRRLIKSTRKTNRITVVDGIDFFRDCESDVSVSSNLLATFNLGSRFRTNSAVSLDGVCVGNQYVDLPTFGSLKKIKECHNLENQFILAYSFACSNKQA